MFETYLHRAVSLSKTLYSPKVLIIHRKRCLRPDRHDRKIVDWDVKPQHKQTNKTVYCYCYHLSRVLRKPAFCICENKGADPLINAFVFATEQPLFFLNPKFQASSHLLWLYSPVCVGPGKKPRRPVFSQRGSFLQMVSYYERAQWRIVMASTNHLVPTAPTHSLSVMPPITGDGGYPH